MNTEKIRILLVEDDPGDSFFIEELLSSEAGSFGQIIRAERLAEALERLAHEAIDVILLDLALPDSLGLDTFSRIHAAARRIPVLVLTGHDDSELAIKALSEGAQDYVAKKDLNARLLVRALHYAIERQKLILELQDALEQVRVLSGLLPICSHCKKIRDDKGYWSNVENYITNRADVQFSHSICPECLKVLYPEFADDVLKSLETKKK